MDCFFLYGILRRHGLCHAWYDSYDNFYIVCQSKLKSWQSNRKRTQKNHIDSRGWKVRRWVADNVELQCCQKVFLMIVAIPCCPNMLSPDDKHSDVPKSTWVPHYIWLKLLHHNSPQAYSCCSEENPQTLSRPPETKQGGTSKLVFSFPLHIGSLDVVTEYLPR